MLLLFWRDVVENPVPGTVTYSDSFTSAGTNTEYAVSLTDGSIRYTSTDERPRTIEYTTKEPV